MVSEVGDRCQPQLSRLDIRMAGGSSLRSEDEGVLVLRNMLIWMLASAPLAAETYVAPCEFARGRPLVPVLLNGQSPCLMALDLAARHLVLDPRVATAFQLETLPSQVSAQDPAHREISSPVVSVVFSPAPALQQVDAGVLQDLSGLSAFLGREIGGLLPAHIPGFEVTVDFARREVLWRDLAEAALKEVGGDTVRMTVAENGSPSVQATIDQQHLHPLQLDLFCTHSLSIPSGLATGLRLAEDTPRCRVLDTNWELLRLERLSVGQAQSSYPICVVTGEEGNASIGLPFLSQFRLTLNYEAGLCRLDPAPGNLLLEPAYIGTGILLQRMDRGYWRVRVLKNSPAARAGVHTGDHLLAVNGKSAAGTGANEVERLMAGGEGTKQTLSLSRSGETYLVELMFERLL